MQDLRLKAEQASIVRNYNPGTSAGGAVVAAKVPEGCNRCTFLATATGSLSQAVIPKWQETDMGTQNLMQAALGSGQTVTASSTGFWNGLVIPRGRGVVLCTLGASSGTGTVDVVAWFWNEA